MSTTPRHRLSLFAFALVSLTLLFSPTATPAHALETTRTGWANGDFESGGALLPPGWKVSATSGGVRAAASTSRALSGTRSLQVDDDSNTQSAWAQS